MGEGKRKREERREKAHKEDDSDSQYYASFIVSAKRGE
jgi:hypothetical protein